MSSSKVISKSKDYKQFRSEDYVETFYWCTGDEDLSLEHPFIAFTTCYCPLCELNVELSQSFVQLAESEKDLENVTELYYELVGKASKHAPELLI